MNPAEGKADLIGSETDDEGFLLRSVPKDMEESAKAAAKSCPVDAIEIYNDDNERIVP
jgi:ferredoxin